MADPRHFQRDTLFRLPPAARGARAALSVSPARCARSAARSRRVRGRQPSRMPSPPPLGARAAPHARAGRAEDSSAECPEPKRPRSLGRTDRDQPTRWRTYESRPNGRVLSLSFSASGPAPPSEPAPNESLQAARRRRRASFTHADSVEPRPNHASACAQQPIDVLVLPGQRALMVAELTFAAGKLRRMNQRAAADADLRHHVVQELVEHDVGDEVARAPIRHPKRGARGSGARRRCSCRA